LPLRTRFNSCSKRFSSRARALSLADNFFLLALAFALRAAARCFGVWEAQANAFFLSAAFLAFAAACLLVFHHG